MKGIGTWILGAATALLALVGLYVAANAHGEVGYYGGLVFFVFAVGLILHQIKRAYDRLDRGSGRH